jgi:hypothetical protein
MLRAPTVLHAHDKPRADRAGLIGTRHRRGTHTPPMKREHGRMRWGKWGAGVGGIPGRIAPPRTGMKGHLMTRGGGEGF